MRRAPFSTCNSCPLIVTLTCSFDIFKKVPSPSPSANRDFERVAGGRVRANLERVLAALGQFALEVLRAVEDRLAALGEERHRGALARGEVRDDLLARARAEVVLVHRAEAHGVLDDGGRAAPREPEPLPDDAVGLAALRGGGRGAACGRGGVQA